MQKFKLPSIYAAVERSAISAAENSIAFKLHEEPSSEPKVKKLPPSKYYIQEYIRRYLNQ